MSPLEQLALGGQGLARGARDLLRPSAWLTLLPLAALEGLALLALAVPTHPLVGAVMAPLVARTVGDRALHYPDGFAALPSLFGVAEAALWMLVAPWVAGALAHAAAARLRGRPVGAGDALGAALRRLPALVLALLPAQLTLLAIAKVGGDLVARGGLVGSALGPLLVIARALVVMAAFLLPARVMIGGCGVFGALATLPRAWARAGLGALVPVVVALAPLALAELPVADPSALVERGTPELVAVALALRAVLALAALVMMAGASALVHLGALGERA
jgi:hypothetical protein